MIEPWARLAPEPLGRAIRAASAADRLGTAFLAGYRSAVEHLVGVVNGSLAATEDGPVHPRAIATRLVDGKVTGRKRFVTGVPGAERLVVLVVAGEGERRDLRAVVVPVEAVVVRPMPALRFVPEVGHAEVDLDGVPVERVVPGDGWADVVRPFRTVEDVHVLAAVHAYLLGAADRAGFDRDAVTALAGTLASLVALSLADPSDRAVHLALAGAIASARRTIDALSWRPGEEADRWDRDRPLLDVARQAREARLAAAWR